MQTADFNIIDTTLREGEQHIGADFYTADRIEIAQALDDFGVDFIEIISPMVSPQSKKDCKTIANLGLKTKVLTHVRCRKEDADAALEAGVQGVNFFMGSSKYLQVFSHGKNTNQIIDIAGEVLAYTRKQAPDLIIRFSTEDSFRTSKEDLLRIYREIAALGIADRFGIADTVGIATPNQVAEIVSEVKKITGKDIEFHGHNDTGCAIANSYTALISGATHIDTTVYGLGERNGITSLAGLIARMYSLDSEGIKQKYNLKKLKHVHDLLLEKIDKNTIFNHYIFGASSFSHKAGLHTNAMLKNPKTYEIINPEDFGLKRNISLANKLTGTNAIKNRAEQLGFIVTDDDLHKMLQIIKDISDQETISNAILDAIIKSFYKYAKGKFEF